MTNISRWFILMAILYACLGVTLGIWIGINQDFTHRHLHAHVNLLGWASMAIFGVLYHVLPRLAEHPLARVHFALAAIGTPIFLIGIPLAHEEITILLAVVGSFAVLAGMVTFLMLYLSVFGLKLDAPESPQRQPAGSRTG